MCKCWSCQEHNKNKLQATKYALPLDIDEVRMILSYRIKELLVQKFSSCAFGGMDNKEKTFDKYDYKYVKNYVKGIFKPEFEKYGVDLELFDYMFSNESKILDEKVKFRKGSKQDV